MFLQDANAATTVPPHNNKPTWTQGNTANGCSRLTCIHKRTRIQTSSKLCIEAHVEECISNLHQRKCSMRKQNEKQHYSPRGADRLGCQEIAAAWHLQPRHFNNKTRRARLQKKETQHYSPRGADRLGCQEVAAAWRQQLSTDLSQRPFLPHLHGFKQHAFVKNANAVPRVGSKQPPNTRTHILQANKVTTLCS